MYTFSLCQVVLNISFGFMVANDGFVLPFSFLTLHFRFFFFLLSLFSIIGDASGAEATRSETNGAEATGAETTGLFFRSSYFFF